MELPFTMRITEIFHHLVQTHYPLERHNGFLEEDLEVCPAE